MVANRAQQLHSERPKVPPAHGIAAFPYAANRLGPKEAQAYLNAYLVPLVPSGRDGTRILVGLSSAGSVHAVGFFGGPRKDQTAEPAETALRPFWNFAKEFDGAKEAVLAMRESVCAFLYSPERRTVYVVCEFPDAVEFCMSCSRPQCAVPNGEIEAFALVSDRDLRMKPTLSGGNADDEALWEFFAFAHKDKRINPLLARPGLDGSLSVFRYKSIKHQPSPKPCFEWRQPSNEVRRLLGSKPLLSQLQRYFEADEDKDVSQIVAQRMRDKNAFR